MLTSCTAYVPAFSAANCPEIELPEGTPAGDRASWNMNRHGLATELQRCLTDADARGFLADAHGGALPPAEDVGVPHPTLGTPTAPNDLPATPPSPPAPSRPERAQPPRNQNQEPKAPARPEVIKDRKIYRNSEDFTFLNDMGRVAPGAKYQTERGMCSFGWAVAYASSPSRRFNLTAGHCGEIGEKIYIPSTDGQFYNVGEFVWKRLDGSGKTVGPGPDYGLIEIYPDYYRYVDGTPPVTLGGQPLRLKGWKSAQWLAAEKPYICRLGWRSGLSCGNYQAMLNSMTLTFDAIQDHGDSGGAIWAMDPADPTNTTVFAVGVASWMRNDDATTAGAKVIEPVMESQGLTIIQ
ncbi:S1 family peptidase [Corynebacterium uberis]|uniref:S1 family peptidase n=1 Tax=Corynebacterium uberis TaxID=2883169 RepID=UPI001D0A77DA|nr:S1 family peptidase [Corynebacterium uberis]UDL73786.1 S1 family peptidase [Corynebacterium uberis]UDL77542.1 S1 family peptidase [Corynebacterium uberis]UDL81959.1 S1 family peptidase [Corynebacterium uberis]UDL84168.1 S1 family peptidase [Corynebacterium uberis]